MTKDLSLNDFMPSSLNIGEDAIFKLGKPLSDDKYRVDKDKVVEILKSIFDPELPVSIYDLGLIYDVKVDKENVVEIKMTLTTPNCPVAESLPKEVEDSVKGIKEVKDAKLELVWEPPWDKSMMSEAAKLELNL